MGAAIDCVVDSDRSEDLSALCDLDPGGPPGGGGGNGMPGCQFEAERSLDEPLEGSAAVPTSPTDTDRLALGGGRAGSGTTYAAGR